MYADFNELAGGGDVAAYVATHYDPQVEYEPVEEAETVRGRDALVRWTERWLEAWEEFRATPDEIVVSEGAIFSAVSVEGRGGESGTEISQPFFHVFELRDGKIRRITEFFERGPALEAAGLPRDD